MSDSDSDFAYESAGEDGELGAPKKEPNLSGDGSIIAQSTESAETEKTQSTVVSDTGCEKDQLTEVAEEVESLTLTDKNTSPDKVQCLPNINRDSDSVNKTSGHSEIVGKDANLANQDAEPKRVQLRLEKKLMEKNQPVLSKTSLVSTSPSEESANVPVPEEKNSPSWGWGSWGTSLLSSAATSVTTFTAQVSQGIGTVLETVETTLGAPPPEELAVSLAQKETSEPPELELEEKAIERTDNDITKEEIDDSKATTAGLFSGVTSLTKVLENTGTKVIMGGLDTLELIGKKTIDILTEGDPGLRKKRAALSEGMTLSQILRDAQSKAEEKKSSESDDTEEDILYTSFFDEFQGLVHLEALEMLTKQCQSKVQSMLNTVSSDTAKKLILDEIENICEDLPSSDDAAEESNQDFAKQLSDHMDALHLPLNSLKLELVQISASEAIHAFEQQEDKSDAQLPKVIYREAISCLAEFTAKCVEHFHKVGELVLVQPDMQASVIVCATHLTELTYVLCIETGSLASRFCDCLNATTDGSEDNESVPPLITSVYLEASNSTAYIQDAFQLLIPVLQLAALQ